MELGQIDLGRYFNKIANEGGKLTEEQIRKFMTQIIKGVQFMHETGYVFNIVVSNLLNYCLKMVYSAYLLFQKVISYFQNSSKILNLAS